MVCSLGGSGRMAVMARVLAAGSYSQTMAEEVGHLKLAAQSICRELREADEANLLDEEDMHVFGLKPMSEPLHLVCCNACKKPVKASQYAAHAELCRSLNCTEELVLELNGSTGNRKPPRKEKKKLLTAYANQATLVGEQEKSEPVDADDTAASEYQLGSQVRMASFAMDAKRNPARVDAAPMMDVSGVISGNMDHSACVMPPPTKRSKLITTAHGLLSNDLETASVVTKSTSTLDVFPCRDSPKGTNSEGEMPNDCVIGYKKCGQIHQSCLPTKDIPVPLATKIYYSQRNNRLRSALNHLYCEASTKKLCSDMPSSKTIQENTMPLQVSSPRDSSAETMGDKLNRKGHTNTLSSVRSPDQILAQSSEVCLGKSGGYPSAGSFSNQFTVDNVLRPQPAPVGSMRSNYLSKPYSLAGNSGKPLGTMQQPNGSVPVI
ncbi:hypothetical protein RGQ29_023863 [Quercus rubra]|uniref:SAGA-associated factor 11 n=1 Tax=Quercus rubra TaxID=3512 RepID=A0AAN7F6F9_QUERU|nr:hypothetical protein RGQ29_023863 [Quercus rubra]KAK4586862.1 hypothetical protein RGQ29_023863 [Quercus rubra]KAK4586863.1 hypothetical protein RGQ29_023863 [Quercus rubra]KAK4586864.1 hypothetical protein RGQ29_023863 [Quercus rubra]